MSDSDEKTAAFDSVVSDAPAAPTPDGATADSTAPTESTEVFAAPTITVTATVPQWHERPRTRWAAIVWGLIIAGIALTTLVIVGSPERRLALADWAATLTPGAFWILSVLVVGVFILVLALLALIRRAQQGRREA
jgi:uncharacterized integral membrane protein